MEDFEKKVNEDNNSQEGIESEPNSIIENKTEGEQSTDNEVDKKIAIDIKAPQNSDKTDVFFGEPNLETENMLKGIDGKDNKTDGNYKKKKGNFKNGLKKATSVLLSVVILILTFVLGYISSYYIQNTDAAFASWAVKQINEHAYFATEEVTSYDLINKGVYGVLDNDPYLRVFTPEETKEMLNESKGISLSIGMTIGEYESIQGLYVFSVVGGSSADKNGVKEDYRVVSVNGEDFWEKSLNDLTNYIKPLPENTDITIVFALPTYTVDFMTHSLDKTVSIVLRKEEFVEKVVYYYDKSDEQFSVILDDDTAYVQLKSFMGDTARQFDEVMNEVYANKKHNLILDLRNNTGGSDVNLKAVGAHLLKNEEGSDKVLILTQQFKNGSVTSLYTDNCVYDRYEFNKVIVLVNEYTASASEALLMAMIDYNTVDLIVGTNTYGKGTGLQTRIMPMTNYAIRFTVSYFFSPYGNSNEKVGIAPTSGYLVSKNINQFPFLYLKDNQFMRAVNYLK